jgi:hypothetical protein
VEKAVTRLLAGKRDSIDGRCAAVVFRCLPVLFMLSLCGQNVIFVG